MLLAELLKQRLVHAFPACNSTFYSWINLIVVSKHDEVGGKKDGADG